MNIIILVFEKNYSPLMLMSTSCVSVARLPSLVYFELFIYLPNPQISGLPKCVYVVISK
jgi:hypothetical protein